MFRAQAGGDHACFFMLVPDCAVRSSVTRASSSGFSFEAILDQHRHIDRSSAQDRWQSENRDMKRSRIALELDRSAVSPTHSSEKQASSRKSSAQFAYS